MDSRPDGVVPATPGLVHRLAAAVSDDHAREIRDTAGVSVREAVSVSVAASVEAYAFVPGSGGEPVFMMGVEPASPITGNAMVWMLASGSLPRHAVGVLRATRWGIGRAFAAAGALALEQYIPEWYETGLRFVRRLGFAVRPTECRSLGGAPLWHAVLDSRQRWFPVPAGVHGFSNMSPAHCDPGLHLS